MRLTHRYSVPDWDVLTAMAEELLAREAAASVALDRAGADGIHSCGPTCQEPACVARREREAKEREG